MRFETVEPADAVGAVLAHSVMLGGRRLNKGIVITPEVAGLARGPLAVARMEAGDVPEADAAAALGLALSGDGVRALPPVHGRVNLAATRDGLLDFDAAALLAVNLADEALTAATLMPRFPVREGDVVATVKVIPFAVPETALAAALGAASALVVRPWTGGEAMLIVTDGDAPNAKLAAKTAAVTAERLARLGMTMRTARAVRHEAEVLAEALRTCAGAALVLVAGASATTDRADVTPEAIRRAGGMVARVGMPADPGNLLVLGSLEGMPVLGLPGCARSAARNGLDLVLERLAAGLAVTPADIAAMGVGGLLAEGASAVPWGWR